MHLIKIREHLIIDTEQITHIERDEGSYLLYMRDTAFPSNPLQVIKQDTGYELVDNTFKEVERLSKDRDYLDS